MSTLLAKNAEVLVTMDSQRRELKSAGLYVENGFIRQVGPNEELPATADTVIDLSGQIVLPGFVNTHHHLNQTLTRNLVAAQNNNLFPWLQAHYRIWARTTEEASRASTLVGLGELALSVEDTIDPAARTDTMNHSSLINSSSKGIQIARRRLQIRPERSE
jgi:8-oxoguanine deaminase